MKINNRHDMIIAACWILAIAGIGGEIASNVIGSGPVTATSDAEVSADAVTSTGSAVGFDGDVVVEVTADANTIYSITVTEQNESKEVGYAAIDQVPGRIITAQSLNVDGVSGATVTSDAIKNAVRNALENGGVDTVAFDGEAAPHENQAVTYTAGTYTGTGSGYNGDVQLEVTFSTDAITDIQLVASNETNHIGTPAFDIMINDAVFANGSGIDAVSGATFTSAAIRSALNDAAEQAGCSDMDAFKSNTVRHEAQAPIDETYDVVVVGGGGAGMAAAAQAAQNGDSVVVVEENAEIGGNTIASGGQYQSVQKYLVWDENDPDATTGEYKGVTYDKVKEANGNISILKTILGWSEEPFDGSYFDTHEFVAGEISELANAGVHEEYLPVLQELKQEIQAYLDWAQPQLDAGVNENELTLFSTVNLHIFQTYYGGLRRSADGSSWIYGDVALVTQFIEGGQDLKGWLEDQGALFDEATQPTIVGALWNRENDFLGCDLDGDGQADDDNGSGKTKTVYNTYIAPTLNTVLVTADNHDENKVMVRTTAENLIIEDGKVTGITATMYDGTEVTLHANKGVVLATGGYAADIQRVMETNEYWKDGAISDTTKTTNRSSLVGSGIDMAEEAGAALTGMGYTQMMPISWIDNGNLAFGGGNYAVYINPTTGKRYVNETGERDVLSLGEFDNGISYKGANGTIIEIANSECKIQGVYPYGSPTDEDLTLWESDVEDRQYTRTVDQLDELFQELGFECTGDQVRETIEAYDMALMTGTESSMDVNKTGWTRLIGNAEQDANGNYLTDTYTLDGVKLKIRLLAPSTHHTMGGVTVDEERHVLDADGNIIPGLYAAGEVTGGIHGGNRLGGNAIVEIFVSGRTAADAIAADNQ